MQHKPWFDEEHIRLLDPRKQAKMQWLQDPIQSNIQSLNNARRETSRHITKKTKEFLKAKIDELGTNSQIKNVRDMYRGINDLRRVTTITSTVKDEKGDLLAYRHPQYFGWLEEPFLKAIEAYIL